jgi:membrane fusion protein (multidrug efflux system)
MARQTLADTAVVAPNPWEGPANPTTQPSDDTYAIASRMVSVGEYVKEGTPLFRLIDDDPIKLRAAVPERYAAVVRVNQPVKVRVEAYSDEFAGRVTRINPQIDPANRTFMIEVLVPNEKHLLKAGAFARASVHTHSEENVVFVPREAVVQFAGVSKVFTVGSDGKAIEHAVEVTDGPDELVEIVKGFEGNQSVVTEGASKLATGVPTKVAPAVTGS